jgi:hypothetical protein
MDTADGDRQLLRIFRGSIIVHLVSWRQGFREGKPGAGEQSHSAVVDGVVFRKMRIRIVPFQDRFTITEDGNGYDLMAASSVRMPRGCGDSADVLLSGEVGEERPLRAAVAKMLTSHPQFAKATGI